MSESKTRSEMLGRLKVRDYSFEGCDDDYCPFLATVDKILAVMRKSPIMPDPRTVRFSEPVPDIYHQIARTGLESAGFLFHSNSSEEELLHQSGMHMTRRPGFGYTRV